MTNQTYKDKAIHIFDYDYTLYNEKRSYKYHIYLLKKLWELKSMGKCLAIASHNFKAKQYVKNIGFEFLFDIYICEYPRSKDTMITEILTKMGYKVEDAIFYDDLKSNIEDVSKLGVVSYLVDRQVGIVFEDIIINDSNKIISTI